MTIDIDVRLEAREFRRNLTRLERREFPFAMARALTRTAGDVKTNTIKRMQRILDRPSRFTLNAFRVVPAKKTNLVARVGFREFTQTAAGFGSYLEPLEFGGPRPAKRFEKRLRNAGIMRGNEFAVPARGVRLNRFGNITGARHVQILSQLQAFNTSGFNANETARSRKRAGPSRVRYFAVSSKSNRKNALPAGIYERRKNGKVKAVFIFVRQPTYRPILRFREGAEKTVSARLPINFRRSFDDAVRTSRLK